LTSSSPPLLISLPEAFTRITPRKWDLDSSRAKNIADENFKGVLDIVDESVRGTTIRERYIRPIINLRYCCAALQVDAT
jgi:hypothetical protein